MILKKKKKIILPTKSWKNHPQKLLRKTQIHFFFLTASTAQMAQTEEFMFQNVAYRPTVYRTGNSPKKCPRKFTQKEQFIHLVCPRKFTFYVHENSATQNFNLIFWIQIVFCFKYLMIFFAAIRGLENVHCKILKLVLYVNTKLDFRAENQN
jgi:hypothetical protein